MIYEENGVKISSFPAIHQLIVNKMYIDILDLIEGAKQARGLTVIIDVFRAFSTACYMVRNGAGGIIPVGEVDIAYHLKEENPDYILMGERQGKILPGYFFDPEVKWAPQKDFDLCLDIGRCDFILKANKYHNGLLVLTPEYG